MESRQLRLDVKTVIDEAAGIVRIVENGREVSVHPLSSPEGFAELSRLWLKSGWYVKHSYSFTWLGRPIIQLPEDLIRIQEVIYRTRPQIIIETGVAHGGSLIFYASLLRLLGGGRVIGIDIEVRPHNRAAIEAHELQPYITLIEGNSITPPIIDRVRAEVKEGQRVLVVLDSKHTKDHVLAELEAYAPLVSVGSYAIATDGIKELVAGGPRTENDWTWDNPKAAAEAFVARNSDFVIEEPSFLFNEGRVDRWITQWSGGFVKRIR
jgi:cephalosporin hydroxylase